MARFNEIMVGRYNRFLQKLLSMKGDAVMPQMASELQPVFPFTNGVENRNLEGWDMFGFSSQSAAGGAGNQSAFRLRNPVGSNVIAVFIKITAFNPAAADQPAMFISAQTTDFTGFTLAGRGSFDPRGRNFPTLQLSRTGAYVVAGINAYWQDQMAAAGRVDMIGTDIQEFPLLPGDALDLRGTTLNQALNATFWWRERLLEESERT